METVPNITENWNHTAVIHLETAASISRYFFTNQLKVAMLVIALGAVLLNMLSLLAIRHSRAELTSHFRLLMSLAVADIFIPVSIIVTDFTLKFYANWFLFIECILSALYAIQSSFITAVFLNLTAIAFDHYVAILKPLHHPTIMNTRNTKRIITSMWIIAFIIGFSRFSLLNFHATSRHSNPPQHCIQSISSSNTDFYGQFVAVGVCFLGMVVMYSRIYCNVWRAQRRREGMLQDSTKKTLFTTLLIIGTFMLCILPLFTVHMILLANADNTVFRNTISGYTELKLIRAGQYLRLTFMLNSICDPLIYAVRIREVQSGYKRMFNRCCPHSKSNRRQQINGRKPVRVAVV